MKKVICTLLASLLLMVTLTGCIGDVGEIPLEYHDNDDFYTITYYMPYLQAANDVDQVADEISKITREKINADVKIVAYRYYEYTQKMTNLISTAKKGSADAFDICYTSPSINSYFTNIEREAFLPLDYMLDNYAPVTKGQISDELWDQARYQGKIYGSINVQVLPRTYGYYLNDVDLFNEFLASVPQYAGKTHETAYQLDVHKLKLMQEYLLWLSANKKGKGGLSTRIDTETTLMNLYGFDDLCMGMSIPGVVRSSDDLSDGKLTVIDQFNSPEYKEMLKYVNDWKAAGLISKDYASVDNADYVDIVYQGTWKPGTKRIKANGQVQDSVRLSESCYYSSYIIGSMNAISETSGNPARAMKFIELMSSDKDIHNLLQFGIEGKHYEKNTRENTISFKTGNGYDNSLFGWGFGTEFQSYLLETQEVDLWDQVKTINDTAKVPAVIGFNFDPSPVRIQIANCQNVYSTYAVKLSEGAYNNPDEMLKKFQADLKEAGSETIIKEKQKQLDKWVAAKKK